MLRLLHAPVLAVTYPLVAEVCTRLHKQACHHYTRFFLLFCGYVCTRVLRFVQLRERKSSQIECKHTGVHGSNMQRELVLHSFLFSSEILLQFLSVCICRPRLALQMVNPGCAHGKRIRFLQVWAVCMRLFLVIRVLQFVHGLCSKKQGAHRHGGDHGGQFGKRLLRWFMFARPNSFSSWFLFSFLN